jgi:hypothetical protein
VAATSKAVAAEADIGCAAQKPPSRAGELGESADRQLRAFVQHFLFDPGVV